MKKEIGGTYLLKLLSLTLMLTLVTPLIVEAQTGKVDFTGSWALNAAKSTLGDNPRMGAGDFIAKQEGNNLSVERTRVNRDGETVTTNMKYTLDGKESINTSVATANLLHHGRQMARLLLFQLPGLSR
jgi:hypothetical protein